MSDPFRSLWEAVEGFSSGITQQPFNQSFPHLLSPLASCLTLSTPLGLNGPSPIDSVSLDTAVVAGPIVAWRLWSVAPNGELSSVFRSSPWPSGMPLKADAKPSPNQTHGIYAAKNREMLLSAGCTSAPGFLHVIGQVALWGTVIEHEHGYRAEYAYPLLIDLAPAMPGFPRPPMLARIAEAIRDRYGCAVRV